MQRPTFEQIVREYLQFIRCALWRLGARGSDLDELVQEVLLAVHRGLPAFDPERAACPQGAVRGWLSGICERQAANLRRRKARRQEDLRDDAELDAFHSASPSPEERYLLCEQRAHLGSLLAELEPERRAVLVSHELDATPMCDVARVQRIPVNTAWNRLRLAREDIRNRWHRHHRRKAG
jgi:RNA polymerase sigma factor (sigma-70 family)